MVDGGDASIALEKSEPRIAHRLRNDGAPHHLHLRRDVQSDADLTMSVIARRSLFVKEKLPVVDI